MSINSLKRRAGDESGVYIVLWALMLVGLIGMVAIVIDLGQLRATRRSNQSAADIAALSAGAYLSGRASSPAVSDPQGACEAAIDAIERDVEGFPAGTATTPPCSSLPARAEPPHCYNTDPDGGGPLTATPRQVLVANPAGFRLTIEYPVEKETLEDDRFALDADNVRSGSEDGQPCERMRVTLQRDNPTFFAGIFSRQNDPIRASSTIRGTTTFDERGVAALLLLERSGCEGLQTSGGGSQGSGVVVQYAGPNLPGRIASDSAGIVQPDAASHSGLGCTTNDNPSGYVIYGTALPAAGGGGPSIIAEDAPDGTPGQIGIYALKVGGRGGAVAPSGIYPAASAGDINSRQFADDKYNPLDRRAIEELHESGYDEATMTVAEATAAGYALKSCADVTGVFPEPRVYVDCAQYSPDNAVFLATEIVFNGKIGIPNNNTLALPNAQRVIVRGCRTDPCSGGNYYSINVGGGGSRFYVNTLADPDVLCSDPSRSGPGVVEDPDDVPLGTHTNTAVVATFNGPYLVSGTARMCQTTVYLGKDEPDYVRQTLEGGGPPVIQCAPDRPCPKVSGAGDGYINVTGGAGTVDWSAPNQLTTDPTVADPFEDLAFWAESHFPSTIKGQGASRTEGVYFMPNARVTFTGQATQAQPLNAQFWSRTLNISGQGSLFLQPNPNDAIKTPVPGLLQLIR